MEGRQSLEGPATVDGRVAAMAGDARTRSGGAPLALGTPRSFAPALGVRGWALALLCALAALLLGSPKAHAATCPTIQDKPEAIPHVNYQGVQHLTYCYGPVTINPGQNVIRINATNLFPTQPGYITRFDPELVYPNGTVPRGRRAPPAPRGLGRQRQPAVRRGRGEDDRPASAGIRVSDRSPPTSGCSTTCFTTWSASRPASTSSGGSTSSPPPLPPPPTSSRCETRWMSVAGPTPAQRDLEPDLPRLRLPAGDGRSDGRYTFPDEATGAARDDIDTNQQTWTPNQPVTLIGTAGHLHPGGLETSLRVKRGTQSKTLFHSKAHYYEPAGAVSWDVSMGATRPDWRVKLQAGDTVSVHSTYNSARADWYEVMGIMPVAVYDGTDAGGVGAFSKDLDQQERLTHGHLNENRVHGGKATFLPDPTKLSAVAPFNPIGIQDYKYQQGDLAGVGWSGEAAAGQGRPQPHLPQPRCGAVGRTPSTR